MARKRVSFKVTKKPEVVPAVIAKPIVVETKPAEPEFTCPSCGGKMILIREGWGRDFKCEVCGHGFTKM